MYVKRMNIMGPQGPTGPQGEPGKSGSAVAPASISEISGYIGQPFITKPYGMSKEVLGNVIRLSQSANPYIQLTIQGYSGMQQAIIDLPKNWNIQNLLYSCCISSDDDGRTDNTAHGIAFNAYQDTTALYIQPTNSTASNYPYFTVIATFSTSLGAII